MHGELLDGLLLANTSLFYDENERRKDAVGE
jgi:hypothetical protein